MIFRLDALIATYGSKQVRDLRLAWSDTCRTFYEAAEEAARRPLQRPDPTKAMRDARDAVVASEDSLQAAIREDLDQGNQAEQNAASFWRRRRHS